ncbi:MAG TPA: hypothetical protein ENG03_00450 [Thioploca sp.]|nr:MAG: hypothetical protein B6247_22080 [Beggiatoa sp. 4572_84]RKZ59703.1 MAG: hypothetical protein DRR08_13270 [Gammaproteobacteria bacterium]HDN25572.1 hypothetical protein [Thioploca sp.]
MINAADYGVPQLRQRVFIIAIKNTNRFQFPEPIYCQDEQQTSFFSLPRYLKVGEAIKGLSSPSPKGERERNIFSSGRG